MHYKAAASMLMCSDAVLGEDSQCEPDFKRACEKFMKLVVQCAEGRLESSDIALLRECDPFRQCNTPPNDTPAGRHADTVHAESDGGSACITALSDLSRASGGWTP
jgi:hypothetical protein